MKHGTPKTKTGSPEWLTDAAGQKPEFDGPSLHTRTHHMPRTPKISCIEKFNVRFSGFGGFFWGSSLVSIPCLTACVWNRQGSVRNRWNGGADGDDLSRAWISVHCSVWVAGFDTGLGDPSSPSAVSFTRTSQCELQYRLHAVPSASKSQTSGLGGARNGVACSLLAPRCAA